MALIAKKMTIAAVSEQTAIAKEVLRKSEARYGFPLPERDASGVRLYPAGQTRHRGAHWRARIYAYPAKPPDELHTLGFLTVEALKALQGYRRR